MRHGIIVGLGVMGRNHQRALATLPDVHTVTVDPDPQRHANYTTLSAAMNAGPRDFACIAAPPDALAELAHQALEAELAILIEKPLAGRVLHAEGIVQDAAQRRLLLSVGYVERFNPAVLELRRRLSQVGRIHQITTRRLSPPPARECGSVTVDLATHDLDIIRWLTGQDASAIVAKGGRDLICALLQLDGGAIAMIEANWLTPTKIRELTILGESGMFALNYATQELSFYEQPTEPVRWDTLADVRGPREGDRIRYAFERREPLRAQWEAFLAASDPDGAPVPAADALATLRLAKAIEGAARV